MRGFNDRATTVQSGDSAGAAGATPSSATTTRAPAAAAPSLRPHRRLGQRRRCWPERAMYASRVDARPGRCASPAFCRDTRARSAGGRAAAVSPRSRDSGELLAVASYPLADSLGRGERAHEPVGARPRRGIRRMSPLDRARHGLYPPGLHVQSSSDRGGGAPARRRPRSRTVFGAASASRTAASAPASRAGAVRSRDRRARHVRPHGTIDMARRASSTPDPRLLRPAPAVSVGPRAALADTAARLGIAVAPPSAPERLRGSPPQAGYGHGDVLATPARDGARARLFARAAESYETRAMAGGRTPGRDGDGRGPPLPRLGRPIRSDCDMRDARAQRHGPQASGAHPGRIAGKTRHRRGDRGLAPSHSWVCRLRARYGPATRRSGLRRGSSRTPGCGSVAAAFPSPARSSTPPWRSASRKQDCTFQNWDHDVKRRARRDTQRQFYIKALLWSLRALRCSSSFCNALQESVD